MKAFFSYILFVSTTSLCFSFRFVFFKSFLFLLFFAEMLFRNKIYNGLRKIIIIIYGIFNFSKKKYP